MESMPGSVHEKLAKLIDIYETPRAALEFVAEHPPIVICGITSAGKDTVARELVSDGGFELVVSHTTRAPRENDGVLEEDSIDYYFKDDQEMLELVESKEFFEVKNVHGKVYGTSLPALAQPYDNGNKALLVIDFQGALEFESFIPGLRPIFLLPPTLTIWRERLSNRGAISEEEFHKRLVSAKREIQTALDNPAFHLLVNYEKEDTALAIRQNLLGRDHGAVDVAEVLLYQITQELEHYN